MQKGIEITNPKGRKIRVLQVLRTANCGGVERLVCDLCGGLEESGSIECGVLFAKSQGPLYAQFDKLAIEKHVDNLRHGVSLSTKRYRRFTETFRRYDVLHLHFFKIGRASCRERVEISVVAVLEIKKGIQQRQL